MGVLAGIDATTWVVIIAVGEAVIVLRALLRQVSWRGAAIAACAGLMFGLLAVVGPTLNWYFLAAAWNAFLYAVVGTVRLLLHRGGSRLRRS